MHISIVVLLSMAQLGRCLVNPQQPLTSIPNEDTFMDLIFGELVKSEETEKYKSDSVLNGHLRYSSDDQYDIAGFDDHHRYHVASSHAIKLNKLRLPHPDDTSDLQEISYFGGIVSFGHFPTLNCFDPNINSKPVDIAIVGAPFDTGVSFRPGARFGPNGIRQAARRLGQGLTPVRGTAGSKLRKLNPYATKLSVVDCGDVPMTPFDNRISLDQLYRAERNIHKHNVSDANNLGKPRIITMGGDHTISLMTIKSAYEQFGQLSVIHFDSHIDTWDPQVLGGGVSHYAGLNHGTFLHYAAEQGYLNKTSCAHVGLRAPYIVDSDVEHDIGCGFETISARDIDDLGWRGVVAQLKKRVGDSPVYISVDIDVLDPAFAPGTGTVETGGWTTRELLSVLDGLEGINLVGADVVEVSPPYDSNSDITSLAASQVIDSFLGLMLVMEE